MKAKNPGPLPPYRVIRSNRRSIALELHPNGELLLRLPMRVSLSTAEQFVESRRGWIEERMARLKPLPPEPDAAEVAALRAKAREILPERLRHWAALLDVSYAGITITGARKRFGSCSAKGRVCFSYLLMRYPFDAIDYVVLHEAAHLKHLNHGPAFHACLRQHMPDYRRREALLKQGPLPLDGLSDE